MSYDPGFANTASTRSSITYIDGEKGILRYRGYPIEELAREGANYLETAYLVIFGKPAHRAAAREAGSRTSATTRCCTRTSRTSSRPSATTPTR